MNKLGILPYIPPYLKRSNLFVETERFVATNGQTSFLTSFASDRSNLTVYKNGLLLDPDTEYTLTQNQGFNVLELIQSASENDVIRIVALIEDNSRSNYQKRQYIFQYNSGDNTLVETPYDSIDADYATVTLNGIVKYKDSDWIVEDGNSIRFIAPIEMDVGDVVGITEAIPDDNVALLHIDWSQIDNVPYHLFPSPNGETEVKTFAYQKMQEVLQASGVNKGSDFIHHDGITLKAKLDNLDHTISNIDGLTDYIKKSGDSGAGVIEGDEWRLSSKNRYFRLFYDSPSEFSGIKTDNNGNIVFNVNGNDVMSIDTNVIGNLDAHLKANYFPKSGMLLKGVGAYAIWSGQENEGELITPDGWTGTWKVMSSAFRGLSNRFCLLLRVL